MAVLSRLIASDDLHTAGVDQIIADALNGAGGTTAPATPTTDGLMSAADKAKLDGVAPAATANSTDAQLRDRQTHTGVQAIATVDGLRSELDSIEAKLVGGALSSAWVALPTFYRWHMSGTGTITIDIQDADGTIHNAVKSFTANGTSTVFFYYFGLQARYARAVTTNTAAMEVIQ
jgi:hypothetical protein